MPREDEDRLVSHRLQVVISPAIKARIERIAKVKKVKPQRIVLEALTYYLPLVDQDFDGEFAEWDRLSDEALVEFEKGLE